MKIKTKREFYRLWFAGALGNRPHVWADHQALHLALLRGELSYEKPIVIRHTNSVAWPTRYDVPAGEALRTAPHGATFNEALDESRILIQGEVMRGERGLELTYSTTPKKMKVALSVAPMYVVGLSAKIVLDRFLSPSSRDDLEAIWDLFPDAVIEFGVYDKFVGDQPHRNTLIWEVRNY